MSSLPWTPEDDAAEVERWASESQRPAPAGPWVSAREATPDEMRMIHRLLDGDGERVGQREPPPLEAELVLFALFVEALVLGPVCLLLGYLVRMAVE